MEKRITRYMGMLILITVLIFAIFGGIIFSGIFTSQIMDGLRTIRISIIDETGRVIFDNSADPAEMENHLSRPEVIDALRYGVGESERFSETLGETTHYYAVRTPDNSILRLALTTKSSAGLMSGFIPIVLICLLISAILAFLVARRLTHRITDPINHLDLEHPELTEYEELLPLAKRIILQKAEINERITELKIQTETTAAILKNMNEGMILIDSQGVVLTANKFIQEIFGDIEHKSILYILREIDFQSGLKQCLLGISTETRYERDGKIYNVHFSPVNETGKISGVVVMFFDITQQYKAEQQRREFSANVSHELKTPLTSISALSQMIMNGMAENPETIKDFAEKISTQTDGLVAIINDIIKLSEFDEDKAENETEAFDLTALAADIADAFKVNEKNVSLRLSGESIILSANKRMIDELIYNLLENGIKYNRQDGQVNITLSCDNNWCSIAVSDTGIGIPKESQSRVFERFYRVDKSRSKKTGGTGLGLSIVKHIAEHHGGKVELDSTEGVGTKVTCTIPQK
ncbi:MAG: ATP-binding protein [Lachnospiraceae bacterium]|nr:ATP-binding protein [Lachnospiraceae bacterium]